MMLRCKKAVFDVVFCENEKISPFLAQETDFLCVN